MNSSFKVGDRVRFRKFESIWPEGTFSPTSTLRQKAVYNQYDGPVVIVYIDNFYIITDEYGSIPIRWIEHDEQPIII